MNTGHEGSLSTCHANSPADALRRLETMVLMGDVALPLEAVREQVQSALDLVVHVARRPGGRRAVVAVDGSTATDKSQCGALPARAVCRLPPGSAVRGGRPGRELDRARVTAAVLPALLVVACGVAFDRAARAARGVRVRGRFDCRRSAPERVVPRLPAMPRWLGQRADAAVPVTPEKASTVWLAAICLAVPGGAAIGGPVLAAGTIGAAVAAPPILLRMLRGRAAAHAEAALPGVLEAVARGLRSGASLRQAVSESAPSAPGALGVELGSVAAATARGAPLVDALEDWAARSPRTGVRLAVAALCLGAETGGAQARAVDGVAATLRERQAVAAEVRALSSQTRASMLVIAASPLAFCAFASATDPRTSTFLFRTPIGVACLAAGVGLDALGALWMRRMCRVPS